jgi:hypothetical protein
MMPCQYITKRSSAGRKCVKVVRCCAPGKRAGGQRALR